MSGHWRKGTCTSCHQPVIWAATAAGKRMPVDQIPVEHGNVMLSGPVPMATVVSKGGRKPGQRLYVSHFSTCPRADKHRSKSAAQPAHPAPQPVDQSDLFGGGL